MIEWIRRSPTLTLTLTLRWPSSMKRVAISLNCRSTNPNLIELNIFTNCESVNLWILNLWILNLESWILNLESVNLWILNLESWICESWICESVNLESWILNLWILFRPRIQSSSISSKRSSVKASNYRTNHSLTLEILISWNLEILNYSTTHSQMMLKS